MTYRTWHHDAALQIAGLSVAGSAAALQTGAGSPSAVVVAWLLGGALVVCATLAWWQSRRAAARLATTSTSIVPLQASLDAALVRISLFSQSQERFVGNLAQELKAPLESLLAHANLLLAGSAEAVTVHRCSKSIAEDLRHLSDLVESFLRLARPSAQEDTSNHVPVHIHDLVIEAVRRCQPLADSRLVKVVPMLAETPNNASVEVLGDATLLESMIENMVRNGVLAAPPGTRVDLHVKIEGEAVVLSVRDHGASIDQDQIESVFQGLFQVPAPPRHSSGIGLSLAIAKRVAEHHRGTISLRNIAEGGCEFAVQLPRWFPGHPPGSGQNGSSPPRKPARASA